MSESVAVEYLGGSDEVHIVAAGVTVQRGGTVDVPAEVAGREPGEWHPFGEADPEHWPAKLAEDGSMILTHDPGEGLLAQVDTWRRAAPVKGRKTTGTPAAGEGTTDPGKAE